MLIGANAKKEKIGNDNILAMSEILFKSLKCERCSQAHLQALYRATP